MEAYIQEKSNYDIKFVYNFQLGDGGLGDCLKFFMYLLEVCIENKIDLYYLQNNIPIEKYIRLRNNEMYKKVDDIRMKTIYSLENFLNINLLAKKGYYIVTPYMLYNVFKFDNLKIPIEEVFEFDEEIKRNAIKLLDTQIEEYISLHLRLGDRFLEIEDKKYVLCPNDERVFSTNKMEECIIKNQDKKLLFFCDNENYKEMINKKYNNVLITKSNIGHTSFANTSDIQIKDTITEFYLLTNSKKIIAISRSGFSIIASKFKNIVYEELF